MNSTAASDGKWLPPDFPCAVSPETAARCLGVTRPTIYALMARGELRSFSIGKSRRIPASELARLFESAK